MRITRLVSAIALAAAAIGCGDPSATAPNPPGARTLDGPQLISAGVPTGSSFGGVGAILIDAGSEGLFLCTGSLIAPTVLLTAGHCILGAGTEYFITFAPTLSLPLIQSTTAFRSTDDDIGVIILPAGSTTGVPVYDLPTLGLLTELNARGGLARERAILVGYGVASLGRGPLTSELDGVRRVTTAKILFLLGRQIVIADAHGRSGQGGTCDGDSGGPVFLAGQDPDLIVAITSVGLVEGCHAIAAYVRLDTPTAQAFLGQFVGL